MSPRWYSVIAVLAPAVALASAPAAVVVSPVLQSASAPGLEARILDPAFSSNGTLAFEANGDLWVAANQRDGRPDLRPEALARLTAGPSWDRDPAWTPDGAAIVFVSDRSGETDLWRLEVDADGRPGAVTQLTSGPLPDTEPSVGPNGTIVFVRGRNATADLWILEPEAEARRASSPGSDQGGGPAERGAFGEPRRLTDRNGPESSPVFSPTGTEIAYVSGGQVRVLELAVPEGEATAEDDSGDGEAAVTGEPAPGTEPTQGRGARDGARGDGQAADDDTAEERPLPIENDEPIRGTNGASRVAWSADGGLLAFATVGGRGGVWVAPRDGSYVNLVADVPAAPAFSSDGTLLALAELPRSGPGYNGDPDRLGDRAVGDILATAEARGRFWIIDAPEPVSIADSEVDLRVPVERESHNAEAFDRVWERVRKLYLSEGERLRLWEQSRETHRPRALAAASEAELEEIIHAMLRDRPPARQEVTGSAAVASAHPLATAAGIEILERGGNVIDAAVAVSFALGVVEPDASGVGGYGQMVLYLEELATPVAIEFLTRVPEDATLDNATLQSPSGPMLANVPGTVRGMELAFERYGSGEVTWAEVVEPSIRLAEEGFELDDAFTTTLALERDRFLRHESSRELFFPDGEPLRPGDRFHNPDLAWTLRQIAESGADAFYEGEVAERIVHDLRGQGNAMTLQDMARYFAVEREPVVGIYRGNTVYSAAPAVSGGVSLVAKLHLLDNTEPFGLYSEDPGALHALVEAWKLQPSSRGRIADPSLWPVDIEGVIDREAAQRRWSACFDPERATSADDLEAGRGGDPACLAEGERVAFQIGEELPCDGSDPGCTYTGTTAYTVADADGNFVAVTQTLGTWGGNFYVTPGLGFLYNDKLRSYGSDPSSYGARLPYARNSTSIAPTLVFRGTGAQQSPFLAVGAAGNAWITSAVYQVITATIDGGLGPQAALEQPRFLMSGRRSPDGSRESVIQHEDGFSPEVMRRLRAMGHRFQPISLRGELRMGYGAAIMIDGGQVRAGADPRRSGTARAIQ